MLHSLQKDYVSKWHWAAFQVLTERYDLEEITSYKLAYH